MTKKERCKELMAVLFGPASARMVDSMGESECVERCRAKVVETLGEEEAKEFDLLSQGLAENTALGDPSRRY